MKRYWIAASGGTLLFMCIFMYSTIGYIPVVGKYVADATLSHYIGKKVDTKYSFPYACNYSTYASGGHLLTYNLRSNTIFYGAYNDAVENQINSQYLSFIAASSKDTIDFPDRLVARTYIDAADTSKIYVKVDIRDIYDGSNIAEQDSERQICELAVQLIEHIDLNCTSIYMDYGNRWGLYNLQCNSGEKPLESLEYDELAKHIEKLDEDRLPLDYIEWRNALTYGTDDA